jgi:hypothetical protein
MRLHKITHVCETKDVELPNAVIEQTIDGRFLSTFYLRFDTSNAAAVFQISHVGLVHRVKRRLEASGFLLEPSLGLETGRWGNETVTTKTASPNGTHTHCAGMPLICLNV